MMDGVHLPSHVHKPYMPLENFDVLSFYALCVTRCIYIHDASTYIHVYALCIPPSLLIPLSLPNLREKPSPDRCVLEDRRAGSSHSTLIYSALECVRESNLEHFIRSKLSFPFPFPMDGRTRRNLGKTY